MEFDGSFDYSINPETKQSKSIKQDLKKYDIEDTIVHEAEKIFYELGKPTKKGSQRTQLLYYCTEMAYNSLGITCDSKSLRTLFGITKQEANKARKLFITYSSEHRPKREIETHEFCVNKYMNEIYSQYSSLSFPITELIHRIIKQEVIFSQEIPSKFSMVVISLVFGMLGISYHKISMTKYIELAPMTFDKMIKKVYPTFIKVLKEDKMFLIKFHIYRIFSKKYISDLFENVNIMMNDLPIDIIQEFNKSFDCLNDNSPRMFYIDGDTSVGFLPTISTAKYFNTINEFSIALISFVSNLTFEDSKESFSLEKLCKMLSYDHSKSLVYYKTLENHLEKSN
jgi:hypothetical protein